MIDEQSTKQFSLLTMLNNSHRYGLVMAGILILFSIILYLTDSNIFNIGISILSFVINISVLIAGMVMASNKYRDSYLNGSFNYGKCLLSAWTTGFVAIIVSGIFMFLFYTFFDPEFMPRQLQEFRTMMEDKIPEEQLEEIMIKSEKSLQPMNQLIGTLIASFIQSGIIALIVSIFIKKKDQSFDSQFKDIA